MSDICNFCNLEEELGIKREYLSNEILDFGMFGEFEITTYLTQAFDKAGKKWHPAMSVQYQLNTSPNDSTEFGWKSVPINFCPICGRDLRKEVSDGETT